jgi:hypothetical protein
MSIHPSGKKSKYFIALLGFAFFLGSASLASAAMNSPEAGYNLCVNSASKIVSFPGTSKCPKGSTLITLGAQGAAGVDGATGPQGAQGVKGETGATGPQGAQGVKGETGLAGLNGVNGSSLLGGVGSPSNSLGNKGDMDIDKNGAYIFGPKSSGLWGNPTAFGGPAGPAGPKGDTGATGPAGPSTAATIGFISAVNDGPAPSSGVLPVCCGNYETILSVTIPTAGTYWASFYTEIWENPNQTNAVPGYCVLKKNGGQIGYQSQNNNKHFIQTLVAGAATGDVITLACAQNIAGNGKAWKASGYALRVGN